MANANTVNCDSPLKSLYLHMGTSYLLPSPEAEDEYMSKLPCVVSTD